MSQTSKAIDGDARLQSWTRRLACVGVGERWELFAATRNFPAPAEIAPEFGVHGVRRPELLRAIALAIERANAMLIAQGRTPWPESAPKVRVCVFGIDDPENGPGFGHPLTLQVIVSERGASGKNRARLGALIALSSRSHEPLWERELEQAISAAVHEWSHCLNLPSLRLRRRTPLRAGDPAQERFRLELIKSWLWLDEGLAIAAEANFESCEQERRERGDSSALAVGGDWMRFGLDWVDRPERALDDPLHRYQAVFFVRYLERLIGRPEFLNEVWRLSSAVWANSPSADASALASLALRLAGQSHVFCSANEADVFASGYCFDAAFLNDPCSLAHEPRVHARFGERAVTAFFQPDREPPEAIPTFALRGLACRYFRILPPEQPCTLIIRIAPRDQADRAVFRSLKAELGFAEPEEPARCQRQPNGSPRKLSFCGNDELRCELREFSRARCHHCVLIVTNCNWSIPSPELRHPAGYPHELKFGVDVRWSPA